MAMTGKGDWFRHDCGASRDPKLIEIGMKHGLAGIGAYWMLVEIMRSECAAHGGRMPIASAKAAIDHVARCFPSALERRDPSHGEPGRIVSAIMESETDLFAVEFWDDCLRTGLFRTDQEYAWSDRIMAEIKAFSESQAIREAAARKAAEARWGVDAGRMRGASNETSVPHASGITPGMRLDATEQNRTEQNRTRPHKVKTPVQPDGWTEWWALYPRKVAKGSALKAYAKALKAGHLPATLKDGLVRAVTWWKTGGTEARFIPHPATWLNGERWGDEAPKLQVAGSAKVDYSGDV